MLGATEGSIGVEWLLEVARMMCVALKKPSIHLFAIVKDRVTYHKHAASCTSMDRILDRDSIDDNGDDTWRVLMQDCLFFWKKVDLLSLSDDGFARTALTPGLSFASAARAESAAS
jgi:hypothetical protein